MQKATEIYIRNLHFTGVKWASFQMENIEWRIWALMAMGIYLFHAKIDSTYLIARGDQIVAGCSVC